MLKILKNFIHPLKRRLCPDMDYYRPCFAQDGEDVLLASFFEAFPPVANFYVDVGAYQPKKFSNTYLLYRQGWRGINIDAMPGSMAAFRRDRPRDVNVETALSATPCLLTYHVFNEQGLNTLDETLAKSRDAKGNYRLLERKTLQTRTLTEVLDEHLPQGQAIALLTVDVEGYDVEVFKSLDFNRYRPQYILAEERECLSLLEVPNSTVVKFLCALGYVPVGKTFRTLLFLDRMNQH